MTDIQKKTTKKILSIIGNTLIWLFVAFSVLVTAMAFLAQGSEDGVPELFGKSLITIQSPSMEPIFKTGDLVLLTKMDAAEKQNLQVGDIVTYHAPIDINGDGQIGDLNTHTIIDIQGNVITTKGENNPVKDGYTISYNDILGKCEKGDRIPGVGGVINFLGSSVGFFLCVVLPLILFFVYELYNFIMILVTEKAKKAPVNKETEEEIKRRAIEEYLAQQKKEEEEKKDE